MAPKRPPGPAMTLGNMRELGVKRLIASCLNDACRHTALIEVWSYPAETEIPVTTRARLAACAAVFPIEMSCVAHGAPPSSLTWDAAERIKLASNRRSLSSAAFKTSNCSAGKCCSIAY